MSMITLMVTDIVPISILADSKKLSFSTFLALSSLSSWHTHFNYAATSSRLPFLRFLKLYLNFIPDLQSFVMPALFPSFM